MTDTALPITEQENPRSQHLSSQSTAEIVALMNDDIEPELDSEELYGIIPEDTRQPYDVREVIGRLPSLAVAA